MTNSMRQLFLVSAVSVFAFTAPAFGETEVAETAEPATVAEPDMPTPEENLMAEILELKEVLQSHSRDVLAYDGDRETSEYRKSLSVWLSGLSADLSKSVPDLAAASRKLDHAEREEARILAKTRHDLLTTLDSADDDLSQRSSGAIPDGLRPVLADVAERMDSLKTNTEELEETRPIIIDLTFPAALTDEERLAFDEGLENFQADTGVVLTEQPGGVVTSLRLEGLAPMSRTALGLHEALSLIWSPPVPIAEQDDAPAEEGTQEETVSVDITDPSFVGLTLD